MDYVNVILLYSLSVLLLQAPWILLLIGAIRRVRQRASRLRRFQFEGMLLVVVGNLAKWLVFDVHFGFDRLGTSPWSYWFSRGEVGFFAIGLILFGLGAFLERDPFEKQERRPGVGRNVRIGAILSVLVIAFVAYVRWQYPWFSLPWNTGRVLLSLGIYPFAAGYLATSSYAKPQAAAED